MSDTAILIIGVLVTILLVGGVSFTVAEFRKMYDGKPNTTKAQPQKPKKQDLENY
ncbi:MAG: hypothetical protein SNJ55_10125 [Chloroherpetonaceae bacterium]